MATEKAAKKFDPANVTVVKAVTRPVLSLEIDKPVYFTALGAIYVGKEIKQKAGDADVKPADIMDIRNLETEQEQQLIAAAVVKANLEETYPKEGYVGKSFKLVKLAKKEGKRYFGYSITEISV